MAALLALFGFSLGAFAAPVGSTFVSYSVDAPFGSTGSDTNAAGTVRAFVKQHGNSDHQRLAIKLSNLDPRTPYTLLAVVGDAVDPVTVTTFATGPSGNGSISYFQNGALKTNGHKGRGAGVSKHALPARLAPLADVSYLSIADTNGEVVLSVSLHEAQSMSYEVATTFANTGSDPDAIGCMAMAIQSGFTQFRLFAAGQSSQYSLWVNDSPVANYFADSTGSIAVGSFPAKAPSPMKFREVCVKNLADAIVLKSTME
jgi:hypothetical protein